MMLNKVLSIAGKPNKRTVLVNSLEILILVMIPILSVTVYSWKTEQTSKEPHLKVGLSNRSHYIYIS
jgi:hypothetical protein